jgi:hypothetical protein
MKMTSQTRKFRGWKAPLLLTSAAALTILVVLLLGASIGYRHPETSRRGNETWARTIRAAIQNWQSVNDTPRCPTFRQLVDEKHLDRGTSNVDSWGHAFEMRCTDAEVYVRSRGPDGIANTDDDIAIPKTTSPVPLDP